jgi:hypothetical protein
MNNYNKLIRAIEKEKKGLVERARKTGIWENFGQKELHKLEKQFDYPNYLNYAERSLSIELMKFSHWAMNYTL